MLLLQLTINDQQKLPFWLTMPNYGPTYHSAKEFVEFVQ